MPCTGLSISEFLAAFTDREAIAREAAAAIDSLGSTATRGNGVLDPQELDAALAAARSPELVKSSDASRMRKLLGLGPRKGEVKPAGKPLRELLTRLIGSSLDRCTSANDVVGEVQAEAKAQTITDDALLGNLRPLCKDPELRTREAGDPSYVKAATFVAEKLRAAGFAPYGDVASGQRTFLQKFSWEERFASRVSESVNVVARLEGKGPEPREAVLVVAHLDNLSAGEKAWYEQQNGRSLAAYEGANDNTSCVAAVLEAARAVAAAGGCQRDVVVLIPSAEEDGLKAPPFDAKKLAGVINLEMIGRNETAELLVFGGGSAADASANPLYDRALRVAGEQGVSLKPGHEFDDGEGWWRRSDHYVTASAGIPSIMLHGRATPDSYHTADDTLEKLNLEKIRVTGRLLFRLLRDLGNDPATLATGERLRAARNIFEGRVWRHAG
jgi:hypothetical protein